MNTGSRRYLGLSGTGHQAVSAPDFQEGTQAASDSTQGSKPPDTKGPTWALSGQQFHGQNTQQFLGTAAWYPGHSLDCGRDQAGPVSSRHTCWRSPGYPGHSGCSMFGVRSLVAAFTLGCCTHVKGARL